MKKLTVVMLLGAFAFGGMPAAGVAASSVAGTVAIVTVVGAIVAVPAYKGIQAIRANNAAYEGLEKYDFTPGSGDIDQVTGVQAPRPSQALRTAEGNTVSPEDASSTVRAGGLSESMPAEAGDVNSAARAGALQFDDAVDAAPEGPLAEGAQASADTGGKIGDMADDVD